MKAPKVCGFRFDCTRNYTISQVEESAKTWDPGNLLGVAQLQRVSEAARQQCSLPDVGVASGTCATCAGISKSGAWCLRKREHVRPYDQYSFVQLQRGQTYYLPHPHLAADSVIVEHLARLLKVCHNPLDCRDVHFLSLNDFGAGVGQYGRALLALDSRYRYRGYDGAGNVLEVSDRFTNYFDLTVPLSLPRADWVMSLEVGEHIPSRFEATVIRNLHAHNCRGIILSWAYLGKKGVGHVNNHGSRYLVQLFDELGYNFNATATKRLRESRSRQGGLVPSVKLNEKQMRTYKRWTIGVRNVSRPWYWLKSVHVFERRVPLTGSGCTA